MNSNYRITDSDMIILQSVESYLKSVGTPVSQNPQEKLYIYQQARDYLYSEIVRRVPRVVGYLLSADLENDTIAQGLNFALSKHCMDPIFINVLMQYMGTQQHSLADSDRGIVGAYLARVLNKWMEQNVVAKETITVTDKDGKKKTEKTEKKEVSLEPVAHLKSAVERLLGNLTSIISMRSGDLTGNQALAVAACIAMDNNDTIKELIASDLPITADVFNCIKDPSNIIRNSLLLDKSELPKLSTNQTRFVDSLKRWVYDKLNILQTQVIYQFLVATYGTQRPDVSTKVINPKDCGGQYSNLFTVAKQMINQK